MTENKNTSNRKHRYIIVNPYRFFTFILIVIMCFAFAGYSMLGDSKANADSVIRYAEVCVQENDTLWNIVQTYNPNANIDIRSAVYDICDVNNIRSGDIHPGDMILVPIY